MSNNPANYNIVDDDSDDDDAFINFTVPVIIKLKGESNLAEWKEAVRCCFSVYRLTKFIDHTAVRPGPEAPRKKRLRFERKASIAHTIIRASVEPVMDVMKSHGWKDGRDDAQGLYDTVHKA